MSDDQIAPAAYHEGSGMQCEWKCPGAYLDVKSFNRILDWTRDLDATRCDRDRKFEH